KKITKMEESESLDSEMTELQEFQDEALSQDDEDEVEELQNSLREVIQDQSVKPKLQCLMVDPSFSMVTVQSEDSGIVWETASSRCSTPWASEASSTSEAYSMEGSGGAGKITIVFDEDKVVRRRTRSGARSSRLGDRLSRPGSSRSASALGVERPEMAEVSLPNIKEEKTPTEEDFEEIKSKDQQLFSLISEGYEILNIRVPAKLPTVDEEETTDLQDNLSYLDQTPKIRSRNQHDWAHLGDQLEAEQTLDHAEVSKSTADIDYIEKFTLLDVAIPGEEAPQLQREEEKSPGKAQTEQQETLKEATEDGASVSEDSFVFVTDADIVGEHLDEVFYGEGPPIEALKEKQEGIEKMRSRRESQRSMVDGGLVLFESEETTLTPIFLSPGPPKIIDPILLEEPTAMSFMYSDLYEDAVGEKRRSDEEYSEAESVASEKSYKRRLSDSDEADGYLEKFRLKDETPAVDVQSESLEDKAGGRMIWPQSKFEMTGSLIRAAKDEEEAEILKSDEVKTQEGSKILKEKEEHQTETEGKQSSVILHDEGLGEIPEEPRQETKSVDQKESKQEEQAVEPSTEKSIVTPQMETKVDETSQGRDETVTQQSFTETEPPCEQQREAENVSELLEVTPDMTASTLPDSREDPPTSTEPTVLTETRERSPCEEGAPVESTTGTADEKNPPEVAAEVKETGDATLTSTELLTESKPSSEVTVHEDKEAVSADSALLEVITDCDCTVQTVEEVMEKARNDEEIHNQVKTDVQEVMEAIPLAPEAENHLKPLTEESSEQSKPAAADLESGVETETSGEITQPAKPKETIKHHQTQQDNTTDCESDNLRQTAESTTRLSGEDSKTCVQDVVNIGDELILLVPKGQAVEMDIQIDKWSEDIIKETVSTPEPDISSEVQTPEPQVEEEPIVTEIEEELSSNELDLKPLAPAPEEEASTEDLETQEDKLTYSLLRSFTPQEDLSELRGDDVHEESDTVVVEMIGEEDAKAIESANQREEEDDESHQRPEEKMETEVEKDELNEADYEIIDAEEESQARLAAELQGMDWFCHTCGCLLLEDQCRSAEHLDHQVCSVEKAYEDVKETLGSWISELQARSENIEDLVSELELAYNSVEVRRFSSCEAAMRAQNEEMMALVMEQYNTMSISMEEEKKAKLEQLYDKIVSYQEGIDSAKTTLETTAREVETDARVSPGHSLDWIYRLQAALDSALTLELGPKGLLVFEDYTKTNSSSSNLAQRKGIPVPQRPTLQPQERGSASGSSVTVYWKVSPGDIIDCFQVYCVEEPQGAVSEEYRVTVKESYCILEDLEPDRKYKVWVMAVNYTGCSLPSDRLIFTTAPSVPAIDTERGSVMWDSATLRWSSTNPSPGLSYTLEYCRQYELEGEGLRSIAGIEGCEQTVVLQPNENYLFYIKAVNEAGASEQSEAALVSTKGAKAFKSLDQIPALLYAACIGRFSCSHGLFVSRCPSILGEFLPSRGIYYWETLVSESPAYRLGVTCSADNLKSSLGENSSSWCLQCSPGPSGCRYQLLHSDVQSSVFVTESPERVGTLLDHQLGCLSFYNARSGQLLGSFLHHGGRPCRPALALDQPGSLQVFMVPEIPEFTKDRLL
uniref:Cardiomyopathy associated 5 n=1 Tax=Poecilia reticulata TaxID=8081 RepID=A0A3P9N3R1_POERE